MARSEKKPLIAIGGIQHESNSFSTAKTTVADFERNNLTRGADIVPAWRESKHEVGGYIEGAAGYDFDLHPTLFAVATPSGPVASEAFETLTGELVERIRSAPPLDGLLLALHGAMYCESHPDGDAEIVRRVRAALPDALPLIVTHDFHANVAPELIAHCDALTIYKTNPHVDQRERGRKAAEIMARTVRGEVRPAQAIEKPALFYNICFQNTSLPPLAPITEETRRLERDPRILSASVCCGYQYADVSAMGPSVVVVTDGDEDLARSEAKRLADMLWGIREQLVLDAPDAAEAVRRAVSGDAFPVVLVELGDNVGGGSAADGTFILSELVTTASARVGGGDRRSRGGPGCDGSRCRRDIGGAGRRQDGRASRRVGSDPRQGQVFVRRQVYRDGNPPWWCALLRSRLDGRYRSRRLYKRPAEFCLC